MLETALLDRLRSQVKGIRLRETAERLVAVPSRTGEAGAALDALAELLHAEGFAVQRPSGGHANAPAVVVRYPAEPTQPGRTLQFDGHIDTVHLPFVPPRVEEGRLLGSGACDMKGGVAAAVEAVRILRDSGLLQAGSVLLVIHDLHEAPWGFGQQLDTLIAEGLHGDAVLIPESIRSHLPSVGRGAATWKVRLVRRGEPVHEVLRSPHEPNIIAVGADLVQRLDRFSERLGMLHDPLAGSETVFIGQFHAGEIYNQLARECWLEGTRRWLPVRTQAEVEAEFRQLLQQLADDWAVDVHCDWRPIRNAFRLPLEDSLVQIFQHCHEAMVGAPLPIGPKAFVDDGNSFWGLKQLPAITHGPLAGGAHTVHEWVDLADLERVALLYALVAVNYCSRT